MTINQGDYSEFLMYYAKLKTELKEWRNERIETWARRKKKSSSKRRDEMEGWNIIKMNMKKLIWFNFS